jgi:hypothetical protein
MSPEVADFVAIEQAAKSLDLALEILQVRNVADFDEAFATAAGQRAGALLMLSSPLFGSSTRTVAELALRRNLHRELISAHYDAVERDKTTVFALARSDTRWSSTREKFLFFLKQTAG